MACNTIGKKDMVNIVVTSQAEVCGIYTSREKGRNREREREREK